MAGKTGDEHQTRLPAFKAGNKVRHPQFGEGIVISIKPSGNDYEVVVAFDGEQVNLKALIRREYALPTTHMSYTLRLTELPENICRRIDVKKGTVGLIYEIFANTEPKKPIYYQETYIPPNQRRLHISNISNVSEYWMK